MDSKNVDYNKVLGYQVGNLLLPKKTHIYKSEHYVVKKRLCHKFVVSVNFFFFKSVWQLTIVSASKDKKFKFKFVWFKWK